MSRRVGIGLALVVLVLVVGGCRQVLVPPKFDVTPYSAVGIVQFSAREEQTFAQYVTQKFIQDMRKDQDIKVVELGAEADVLKAVGQDHMGPDAVKAIGEKYGVKSVITGELNISDIRPKISIAGLLTYMSVEAEVDASLTAHMMEVAGGATLWTGQARDKEDVGHVGFGPGHNFHLDAQYPDEAYGELVEHLVHKVTRDLRHSHQCVCR